MQISPVHYDMPSGTDDKAVRTRHRNRRRRVLVLPRYTVGEEIFNGVSHGVGAALAVAALVLLLLRGTSLTARISCAIFGGSMILLYTISCLYHSLKVNRGKKVLQVLDHCTIYLLIAGTETPLSLLVFPYPRNVIVCAVAWGIAVFGIILNAVDMRRFRVVSMICYIGLGWMIAFFFQDLFHGMDIYSLVMLILGGVIYTVGAILFGLGRKIAYMHSVFHLFVLAGSFFHFLMIYHIVG